MHTRQDSLDICKTCKKRSFDMKTGIICSITNEQRLFVTENECPDYQQDTLVIGNDKHKTVKQRKEVLTFLIIGGISTVIGVLASVVLLMADRVSIWLMGLILIGISLLVHGYNKDKKLNPSVKKGDTDILDEEIR
jgi:hypothetical protein